MSNVERLRGLMGPAETDATRETGRLASVLVPSRVFNADNLTGQAKENVERSVEKYVWESLLVIIVPTLAVNGPMYAWSVQRGGGGG